MAIASSEGYVAWDQARELNDFASFQPKLERLLELSREQAELYGYETEPYDALHDLYEEGSRAADVAPMFEALREPTNRLLDRQPEPDTSILERSWHVAGQEQFARADCSRRAAPHAVEQRDHLRHVGHRDLLAPQPGRDHADRDAGDDPAHIVCAGDRERRQRRDDHADTRPLDARARRDRRGHALDAEDEQRGSEQVAGLGEGDEQGLGVHRAHAFFPPLLDLNISSMRSVTT